MQRTAFLSVFGALVVAKSAGADAPDIIRAAASLDDDATPYLYAMAGGVFKKYGLDAHVERAASGAAVAASILGGAFEIGKVEHHLVHECPRARPSANCRFAAW
jgi:ABC-type nitrate/sulfonate/bicarbonate transport system substrate-binding protein